MDKVKIIQMKVSESQLATIKSESQKLGLPTTVFCRFVILNKILNSSEVPKI